MNNHLPKYKVAKNQLTLKQKVGQLFMPAAFINDTEEEVQKLEHLINTLGIGALCFFHSRASAATNFEGKKKVVHNKKSYDRLLQLIERYQKAANVPLLIAIDAEWGLAMRIEDTPQYPYAITLGAVQDQEGLLFKVGENIGLDCQNAGIHWNLAPVVDINNNPENPVIGYRSFGDDKDKVTSKSTAIIQGMSSVGILNAIKHFPGHGDTATDSHLGLPVIDKSKETLVENELFPFKKLIQKGIDSVMVGHLQIPSLDSSGNPATTSYPIITELLRKELGFEGVIISDALNMHAVSKKYSTRGTLEAAAFQAGMDMMCFSEHPSEGIEKILDSATSERIEESFKRIWELKEKAFGLAAQKKASIQKNKTELNQLLAQSSITNLISGSKEIEKAKTARFLNLAVDNTSENRFSYEVEVQMGQKKYLLDPNNPKKMDALLQDHDQVLLALFPPSVKPNHNFGLSKELVLAINSLMAKKKVILYLFGNPYALDVLDCSTTTSIVIVYQDFMEFQQVAFGHFSGEIKAKGKLPVQLKTINP